MGLPSREGFLERRAVVKWRTALTRTVVALLLSLGMARAQEGIAGLARAEQLRDNGENAAALEVLEEIESARLAANDRLRRLRLEQELLVGLERWQEASVVGRRWLDEARAAGTGEEAVWAAVGTATSCFALGRYAEAREALEIVEGSLAAVEDDWLRLTFHLAVGRSLTELSDLAGAARSLDRAEELGRKLDEPEAWLRIWSQQAVLEGYRDNRLRALELREKAVALSESLGESSLEGQYTNLAMAYQRVHDYASCLNTLDKARSHASTGASGTTVTQLATEGICAMEIHQLDRARDALEAARGVAIERRNSRLESWAVGELGLVELEEGDEAAAVAAFDRAIALAQSARDSRNEIVWWMNAGRVRRDQQQYDEALRLYRHAESLYEQIPGLRVDPNLYKHIAQCYVGLGDDESAAPLLERALSGAKEIGSTKVIWETEREIGRLHRRAGDRAQARLAYFAALDAVEWMRSGLRLDVFKADFFEDKVALYEEVVDFLMSGENAGAAAGEAFAVAERARARAFLDSLMEIRAQLEETLPEAVVGEEERLLDEVSRLQAELRQGLGGDREQELEEVESSLEALYLDVRSRFPQFHALRSIETVDLAAVQAVLGDGEGLLELFLGSERSHGWLVTRDGVLYRPLESRAPLEAAVRRAYTELVDPKSQLGSLAELNRQLLEPFTDELRQLRSLVIVPSGALFYFPFEVLPFVDDDLLGKLLATAYVPSASTLVELRSRPARDLEPLLLAVGGADYGDPEALERGGLRGLEGLGGLPHSRREVEQLGSMFWRRSTLLLGAEAAEARLKSLSLSDYSVIHLATHGWIDPVSPARSGLVFSRESETSEDGILQPREILRLPLRADLVTLSACQSGLGDLVTGEGMVGLARAFFFAGTDSVVASLWNVNDRANADFMEHFYRALERGASKAEALAAARHALRQSREYSHPYYWAPYVLLGRGEDGVAFPTRPRLALIVLLWASGFVLLGFALLAVWRRSKRGSVVR